MFDSNLLSVCLRLERDEPVVVVDRLAAQELGQGVPAEESLHLLRTTPQEKKKKEDFRKHDLEQFFLGDTKKIKVLVLYFEINRDL